MKRAWHRITGFCKRLTGRFRKSTLPDTKHAGKAGIINPRASASRLTTITPHRFKLTRKQVLSVVRPYDYINVPPRRSVSQGGEK